MDPGGAIGPALHLGCSDYRAGVRQECDADGHTRLRKRAFLTRPTLGSRACPIRTRTTRMSGASGGVIAFWPRETVGVG
jgi:hypothetical protein